MFVKIKINKAAPTLYITAGAQRRHTAIIIEIITIGFLTLLFNLLRVWDGCKIVDEDHPTIYYNLFYQTSRIAYFLGHWLSLLFFAFLMITYVFLVF